MHQESDGEKEKSQCKAEENILCSAVYESRIPIANASFSTWKQDSSKSDNLASTDFQRYFQELQRSLELTVADSRETIPCKLRRIFTFSFAFSAFVGVKGPICQT